jgi:hypothetical protein
MVDLRSKNIKWYNFVHYAAKVVVLSYSLSWGIAGLYEFPVSSRILALTFLIVSMVLPLKVLTYSLYLFYYAF